MYPHTLDLRELADEWEDELDDPGNASPYAELCDDLGTDSTPEALREQGEDYDPTLIHENDFPEYAQELADELGLIPAEYSWPTSCIDWEQAARELAYDYSLVTFHGDNYYIRST